MADYIKSYPNIISNGTYAKLRLPFPSFLKYDDTKVDENDKTAYNIESFGNKLPKKLKMLKEKNGLSEVKNVNDSKLKNIVQILPKHIRHLTKDATWQVVTADNIVLPHRDPERKTALNYYFIVNGKSETIFYKNPTDEYIIPELGYKIYSIDWLTRNNSFTANAGDIYLLNVNEIHSVSKLSPNEKRVSLSFDFNEPFEVILELLHLWTFKTPIF
jgi:hypothetical protein